jgi:hypothetical protein
MLSFVKYNDNDVDISRITTSPGFLDHGRITGLGLIWARSIRLLHLSCGAVLTKGLKDSSVVRG